MIRFVHPTHHLALPAPPPAAMRIRRPSTGRTTSHYSVGGSEYGLVQHTACLPSPHTTVSPHQKLSCHPRTPAAATTATAGLCPEPPARRKHHTPRHPAQPTAQPTSTSQAPYTARSRTPQQPTVSVGRAHAITARTPQPMGHHHPCAHRQHQGCSYGIGTSETFSALDLASLQTVLRAKVQYFPFFPPLRT